VVAPLVESLYYKEYHGAGPCMTASGQERLGARQPRLRVRAVLSTSDIDLGRARRATGVRDSFQRESERERERDRETKTRLNLRLLFPLRTKLLNTLPHLASPARANLRVNTTLSCLSSCACVVSRVWS
jgi:hypothetical protein